MTKKTTQKWKKQEKSSDQKMKNGRSDDVIIPIMGATGAGKSTFINAYVGRDLAKVGNNLESCTPDVSHYIINIPRSKRRLVLVDTPGFNDSFADESEILRRISVWLAASYDDGMKVAGVIYLSDISLKRMYGSIRTNLFMFQKLCGPDFFKKVIMTTTHWDDVAPGIGEQREKELKETFWQEMVAGGSVLMRKTSASDVHAIVNRIVEQHLRSTPTGKEETPVLTLQRELVDLDKIIPATKAGQTLKTDLQDFLKRQKEAEQGEPDPARKEELKQKRLALQQQIKELNVPFSVRFLSFFGL